MPSNMRGSESVAARPHPPFTRPPVPPSCPHPPKVDSPTYKPSAHHDRATSGNHVDITSVSGQSIIRHRRVISSCKSDVNISYKRVMQNDARKEGGGSDVISRPSKTKMAKSKLDEPGQEMRIPKYSPGSSYSKLPKRGKAPRRDRSEKITISKLPKDEDRPGLGRRSRTFIIEPQLRLSDSYGVENSQHKTDIKHQDFIKPDPPKQHKHKSATLYQHHEKPTDSVSVKDTARSFQDKSPTRDSNQWDTTKQREGRDINQWDAGKQREGRDANQWDAVKQREGRNVNQWDAGKQREERDINQWDVGKQREGGAMDQWEAEEEVFREGARNPLYSSGLPARPKSAGQTRYCETDDSDESSLDGEIEIVDIDKELENDPDEPSPYWTHAQPLQVPEVFIHNNPPTTSPSTRKDNNPRRTKTANPHLDVHHHNPRQHHQQASQSSSPPRQNYVTLHQQQQQQQQQHVSWSAVSRQRHGSGESDFSVFSDTGVKSSQTQVRRRFLSEPEILKAEDQGKGRSSGNKARPKKTNRPLEESARWEGVDLSGSDSASSGIPKPRERLYSDSMERMLSRYSEMGLREMQDDVHIGKGRVSKIPVGHHYPNAAGSRDSMSGHVLPPRKLKPILKPPKNDYHLNSSS